MRRGFLFSAFLLLIAVCALPVAGVPLYSLTEIGELAGSYDIYPSGVNNDGRVVGACALGSYNLGFSWQNGTIEPLSALGGSETWAYNCNDAGLAVGRSEIADGYYFDDDFVHYYHACLWQNGVPTDLGVVGGYFSYAVDINNAGQIVGNTETNVLDTGNNPVWHPFIRSGTSLVDLNTMLSGGTGWELTEADAVNDLGQVVGSGKLNGTMKACVFDTVSRAISEVSGITTAVPVAVDINNLGQVTGTSETASGEPRAYIWSAVTGTTDLGILPDYIYTYAGSINDAGQVVGSALLTDGSTTSAFIWQGGEMTDLNTLIPADSGWILSEARSINNAGQILCYGINGALTGAVLLTPPPLIEAKKCEDNTPITTNPMVVTAAFTDFFYVESEDRTCGIRVNRLAHGQQVGSKVSVTGKIKTNTPDDERYIEASGVAKCGTGSITPFGMTNASLGGADWAVDEYSVGQKGVTGGKGPNNIGLLVRTWGKVIDNTDGTKSVDDGSGTPVKLDVPTVVTIPSAGNYVSVTGISSCCKDTAGNTFRLLRVRNQQDVN